MKGTKMIDLVITGRIKARLRKIATADIVVGIPSYKNAKTVGHMVTTVADGLVRYFPSLNAVIFNADGGSSDNTPQIVADTRIPRQIKKVVAAYEGLPGKGSAVHATFEAAVMLGARVCLVLEADLRSITPEWIERLAAPILRQGYDLVLPHYSRNKIDGGVTNNIVYPITRLLYAKDIRQPAGGDFAVSGQAARFFLDKDVWETDVARAGLDVWLTTVAINEECRVGQAGLGTKAHDVRDPTVGREPPFLQSIGTLFRMMHIYRKRWQLIGPRQSVPIYGPSKLTEPEPAATSAATLIEAMQKGAKRYDRLWKTILAPQTMNAVEAILALGPARHRFPADLWAKVVFDFAVVYNKGEGDPDKVAASLLPLHFGRLAAFLKETQKKSPLETEEAVQAQAAAFEEAKLYLIDRWEGYVPWVGTGA